MRAGGGGRVFCSWGKTIRSFHGARGSTGNLLTPRCGLELQISAKINAMDREGDSLQTSDASRPQHLNKYRQELTQGVFRRFSFAGVSEGSETTSTCKGATRPGKEHQWHHQSPFTVHARNVEQIPAEKASIRTHLYEVSEDRLLQSHVQLLQHHRHVLHESWHRPRYG